MGILKQLAAGGATTVMHGLEPEAALRQKADAVAAQYGTPVGTAAANLLHPQEIRCLLGGSQLSVEAWPAAERWHCLRSPRLQGTDWVPLPSPCRDMVARVQEEFGKLDILVNK